MGWSCERNGRRKTDKVSRCPEIGREKEATKVENS